MRTLRSRRTRITRRMMRTRRGGGGGRGVRVGVGAGICPELEPEISKMGLTGGNTFLKTACCIFDGTWPDTGG